MSLAMYAAPFDNDITQIKTNDSNNDNLAGKRRIANNKTVKKYPKEHSEKINSVMQTINNLPSYDDYGDSSYLADFTPIPPPASAGVESTRSRESSKAANGTNANAGFDDNNYNDPSTGSKYESASASDTSKQYSRYMPNYDAMYKNSQQPPSYAKPANDPVNDWANYYQQNGFQGYRQQQMNQLAGTSSSSYGGGAGQDNNDILMQKLNYMINLLEQNQDERTNNVTEEIVLYSFLGIFIIFIVDSFVRVGKYVR